MPNETMRLMRAFRHTTDGAINLRQRRQWFDESQSSQVDTTPAAETGAPDATDKADSKQETFSREYVKELRDEAAKHRKEARDLQKRLEAIESEKQGAEDKKLAEQNEWKALAEKRQAELDKVKAEAETERLNLLRLKVGLSHKLPEELIERLKGSNEDELKADAEFIAKVIGLNKETETPAEKEAPAETPAQAASRKQTTTTANPSGQPVGRTDVDRRAEYFGGANSSPIFQGGGVVHHGKSGSE